MKRIIVFFLVVISLNSFAQETDEKQNIFKGTRLVNGHSTNLAQKGKLNLFVQHRFGDVSGGFYELFGLDQATMRLGFEYGFTDDFTLGIGRSSFLKSYDAFAKFKFVQQSENFPVTIALAVEGNIPSIRNYFPDSQNNFADKFSGSAMLLLSNSVKTFGVQLSPGYLNTGYILSENKGYSMFILGLAGSVRLSDKVSANLEYLHNFHNEFSNTKPLSVGIDIDTGGHLFQLILSNSQQFTGGSLYSYTLGEWSKGNLFFGFNLVREFRLKYY